MHVCVGGLVVVTLVKEVGSVSGPFAGVFIVSFECTATS